MPPIRQAGAITFRETSDGPEVLLVRAKREPHDWIFPKGHQEKGETLAETAVRELKEEGGVVGKPLKSVGVSTFRSGKEDVKVTYFLVRDRVRRRRLSGAAKADGPAEASQTLSRAVRRRKRRQRWLDPQLHLCSQCRS